MSNIIKSVIFLTTIVTSLTRGSYSAYSGYKSVNKEADSYFPSEIENCYFSSPEGCKICDNGYFRKFIDGKAVCTACPSGCKFCPSEEVCMVCKPGFFIDDSLGGKCRPCIENCDLCFDSEKCQKCARGSHMLDGECNSISGTTIFFLLVVFASFACFLFYFSARFLFVKTPGAEDEYDDKNQGLIEEEEGNNESGE